jgi:hypothetical protein
MANGTCVLTVKQCYKYYQSIASMGIIVGAMAFICGAICFSGLKVLVFRLLMISILI